jgi:sirohydrochlorin cobaltochelatase
LGILLVGHGTRSDRGASEFLRLANRVGEITAPLPVEAAFLEMCEPTIGQAVRRLVERGVKRILVSPLLLFAAGHAKRDIPTAVGDALTELGVSDRVTREMTPHLGCHPAILQLSAQRFEEAIEGRDAVPASQTCLVLVGRGSNDDSATAEMHEFARLRKARTPAAETHVAFLAMAQPRLDEVLARVAAGNWRRIVVQPHLLFHGELYDALAAYVVSIATISGETEWIITSYLAGKSGDELVTQAVLARLSASLPQPWA